MRPAPLMPLVILVAACSRGVEERLVDAERALDAGDLQAALLAFAEIADASEPRSAVQLRARLGMVDALTAEAPARAEREFLALVDSAPDDVTPDDWLAVLNRLGGAGNFDTAARLCDEARRRLGPDDVARVAAIAERLEARRRAWPSGESAELHEETFADWDGAEFTPSAEFAQVCLLAATNAERAYQRYLDLARAREPTADDYGALALAFHRAGERTYARWVLWSAAYSPAADPRTADLSAFLAWGKGRGRSRPRTTICDGF